MIKRPRTEPSPPPEPAAAPSPPVAAPPPVPAPPLRWRPIVAGVVLLAVAVGAWFLFKPRPQGHLADIDETPDDPRFTFATPFRNVRPDVKYVGDQACAGCHKDETHAFHQHAMGRSITPIAQLASQQPLDAAKNNPFHALGKEFRVERTGDAVSHTETVRDGQGQPVVQTRADVQFAIGSGAHASSYLVLRGDRVVESPITWYPQKQRWDLSPGFNSAENADNLFSRPVGAECLFCHANRVEPVEGSMNRYKEPLFPQGSAIGCERCHGPGELHVRERQANQEVPGHVDHSIVNPRHLEPQLRENVCQQCHLEGNQRVLRRGRGSFDYRPGLPLHLFYSSFVFDPEQREQGTFTGHVEQMYASRCFTACAGKLGCVTCHDPHTPTSAIKPEVYRNTCINCHQDKPCSLPTVERQKKQDNCVACHMPRAASTDIQHTAISDHRIRKKPGENAPTKSKQLREWQSPLLLFQTGVHKLDDAEARRDLGLALAELLKQPGPSNRAITDLAEPMLDDSLKRWPTDAPALEAKAFLLYQQGRPRTSLELVERVLARPPRRESALAAAANFALAAGDQDKALAYSKEAVVLNPYLPAWRYRLADLHVQRRDYDQAITECRDLLAIQPGAARMRMLLTTALLRSGQSAKAHEELATLQKMNPASQAELREWFERQKP